MPLSFSSEFISMNTCFLKNSINQLLSSKIVIASTGRSGSTLLFNSIRYSYVQSFLIPSFNSKLIHNLKVQTANFLSDYLNKISDLSRSSSPILKTHSLPSGTARNRQNKIIFVFGCPKQSAYSAYKMACLRTHRWLDQHIYHLGGYGSAGSLFTHDVLNYEFQLQQWKSYKKYCLFIHYEDLWVDIEKISDFVGFPVSLPPRRARDPIPSDILQKLDNPIYNNLSILEQSFRNSLLNSN